jgi:protein-S-isoprenylcysteine O-methyltransferase
VSSFLGVGGVDLDRVLLADVLLVGWGIAEAAVHYRTRTRQSLSPPGVSKDHGTFAPIIVSISIALLAPFILLSLSLGPVLPLWVGLVGAALVVGGAILRVWAFSVLGRFFSVFVVIRADHQIVKEGPYHLLRHPSYTGLLFIALGTSLLIGPLFGVILATLATLASLLNRIRIEERALLEKFGVEYADYRTGTWRLLPGVF